MASGSFQHVTSPLRLFAGAESLGQLGRELDRVKSSRAALVCGNSMARNEELVVRVRKAIGDRYAGMVVQARAHSPIPAVQAAADELKQLDADAVIAIGGGSAIVTARAASILWAEGRPAQELCTVPDGKGGLTSPRLMAPKLPQFVIPTTPTTAAVKAGSAVFDPSTADRLALFDPKTRATAVFLDPLMLGSAPRPLVVSSAVNTFATAMEGLMSRTGNPLADAQLMHSVRLLSGHLSHPETLDDEAVRQDLAVAAVLCGQGTDHSGAGITTVLGHAIGARHELDNGVANAIVLAHVLRFNASAASEGLAKVAAALGISSEFSYETLVGVIDAVEAIFGALNLPRRLRDVGIESEALVPIAEVGMRDWFLRGNPRQVQDAGELQQVLTQAW